MAIFESLKWQYRSVSGQSPRRYQMRFATQYRTSTTKNPGKYHWSRISIETKPGEGTGGLGGFISRRVYPPPGPPDVPKPGLFSARFGFSLGSRVRRSADSHPKRITQGSRVLEVK